MRWTLFNLDGEIVNIILWDGVAEYHLPPGLSMRPYKEGDQISDA